MTSSSRWGQRPGEGPQGCTASGKGDWTHDARDALLITVRRADLRSMCLRGAPRLHAVHRAMAP